MTRDDGALRVSARPACKASAVEAFYERFSQGNVSRTNLLYGHIFFNSLAFVLMMVQLFRTGTGPQPRQHRALDYLSLGSLTIGVVCACPLAAEHGPVGAYGGNWSTWGF